eukprot:4847937-Prymnesium_polylepis.1
MRVAGFRDDAYTNQEQESRCEARSFAMTDVAVSTRPIRYQLNLKYLWYLPAPTRSPKPLWRTAVGNGWVLGKSTT